MFSEQLWAFWQMHSHVAVTTMKTWHCPLTLKISFIHYCSQFFPPTPQTKTDLFSVSVTLLCPEFHTNGIIKYIDFWAWLFSLSIRLTHVIICLLLLFLCSLDGWTTVYSSIYQLRYFHCFQFGQQIRNKHLCTGFVFDKSMFNFEETATWFFRVAAQFCILTSNRRELPLPHSITNTYYCILVFVVIVVLAILKPGGGISFSFDLHFLNNWWCWVSSGCLFVICLSPGLHCPFPTPFFLIIEFWVFSIYSMSYDFMRHGILKHVI